MLAIKGEALPPCGVPSSACVHVLSSSTPAFKPFLDESDDALIPDPVLDELHRPLVRDGIEKSTNVRVKHVVHFLGKDGSVQGRQCIVRAAPRAEAIRESEKFRFIHLVEYRHRCLLDDLVL